MPPGTPILDPPFSRNFRRLVLGCIKTDFYNQILILQDFSRSTRFTFLCTAPNSNFQQKFKLFDIFYWNICKFCKILIKIIIFEPILMKFCRNFTKFDDFLSLFLQNFRESWILNGFGGTGVPNNFREIADFQFWGVPGGFQPCQGVCAMCCTPVATQPQGPRVLLQRPRPTPPAEQMRSQT